jgi:hypothetical protein
VNKRIRGQRRLVANATNEQQDCKQAAGAEPELLFQTQMFQAVPHFFRNRFEPRRGIRTFDSGRRLAESAFSEEATPRTIHLSAVIGAGLPSFTKRGKRRVRIR